MVDLKDLANKVYKVPQYGHKLFKVTQTVFRSKK